MRKMFYNWISGQVAERSGFMQKRFVFIVALAFLAFHAGPVSAQAPGKSAKEFDQDLEAFKARVEAAKAGKNQKKLQNFDLGDSPDPDAGTGVVNPLGNPLGPAANLPMKGSALSKSLRPSSPEDLQARMKAEAEERQSKLEAQAFEAAIKQLMPLSVEQMRTLYKRFEINREAAETTASIPEFKTRTQTITLEPDQIPPVIRMSPGYVTTVSILDATGAPWPVEDVSYAGDFDIKPPENGGHMFRMSPTTAHGVGNMSMRLVDLMTPVIFTLTSGIETVDYRYEARVARPGPLAKTPIIEYGGLSTVAGTDANLASVLDGTIPAGAERLDIQGVDGRTAAYRIGGRVYLRTPLSLLSPAWEASVGSSDGTMVYTLNDTPVIILSDNGRMVRAHIAAANEVIP